MTNNDKIEILYYLSGVAGSANDNPTKMRYSITCLGFPGSANDNPISKYTQKYQKSEKCLSPTEYGLPKTVFGPCSHCVRL